MRCRIRASVVDLPVPVDPSSAKCLPSKASIFRLARMARVGNTVPTSMVELPSPA
jgi:hypothetical protein